MNVIDRVNDVILSVMPGADPHLARLPDGGAVSGFVLWEGFEDLDPKGRQDILWSGLRRELTPQEQLELTAIFTLTPEEYKIIHNEDDGE